MRVVIRRCNEYDAGKLSELGKTTFYDTWISISSDEDIQSYLEESYSEDMILRHLKSDNNIYYAAEDYGNMVGFVRLRYSNEMPEQIKFFKCLEVAQIYVNKDFHDKKVGAALMNQTLEHAADNGFEMIWLGTWEDNSRAMTFYTKFGFEKFGRHAFIMGKKVYEDVLMKRKLQ